MCKGPDVRMSVKCVKTGRKASVTTADRVKGSEVQN